MTFLNICSRCIPCTGASSSSVQQPKPTAFRKPELKANPEVKANDAKTNQVATDSSIVNPAPTSTPSITLVGSAQQPAAPAPQSPEVQVEVPVVSVSTVEEAPEAEVKEPTTQPQETVASTEEAEVTVSTPSVETDVETTKQTDEAEVTIEVSEQEMKKLQELEVEDYKTKQATGNVLTNGIRNVTHVVTNPLTVVSTVFAATVYGAYTYLPAVAEYFAQQK